MISSELRGPVAVLRLEHGKANAMDVELLSALAGACADVAAGPATAVVLTGTGGMFSAGVDLFRLCDGGPEYAATLLDALDAALHALFTLPLPLVTAVNGHAIAGGCIVAVTGDRVLLADGRAKLGVTELKVGVRFPTLAIEVFRSRLLPAVAEDLVLSARLVGPAEALRLGIVDELVPPENLLDRAVEVAAGLGALPRAAYADAKRTLRQPVLDRIAAVAARRETEVRRAWTDPATLDAIRRFLATTVGRG
jgi:enoyl-CoA hydratase